ncbi:MAG TPA: hypothetical protein VE988_23230 [Gemmataceae bacterium]|nr:hypothetical protein [Gemmataceae bacterium]
MPYIVPFAKAVYLCDGHLGFANQKTDLIGIFNSIRASGYPHLQRHFVIFAQLIGGLGQIPFYFDVTFPKTGKVIHTTSSNVLTFPRRNKLIQLAYTMMDCSFPTPGIYLVELYCDGQWVADTSVDLL